MPKPMDHENTIVYARAIALVTLCSEVIDSFPTGFAFLADQIRRASSSIVLNFVEGNSHTSRAERARYFRSARGSAKEIAGALDVAHALRAITKERRTRGKELCAEISALLYRFP